MITFPFYARGLLCGGAMLIKGPVAGLTGTWMGAKPSRAGEQQCECTIYNMILLYRTDSLCGLFVAIYELAGSGLFLPLLLVGCAVCCAIS